ncbi:MULTISPECIES: hypothetical protein [Streptomyces]|uniref:Uncharacterized protein n=1 Tax=Streptomyces amritsarensis TaxID=681158 RepID=A0ABX3FY94_9ACTN|nr:MULTISPECIES: hypothetical protein [Streptomyces]AQT70479.1 hypothetical protein B1K54_00765 [Streptomyces sp. fd1-xmd]OLZ55818.1 hypothetical protein AVW11_29920 [Streptomyces amritsarensis]
MDGEKHPAAARPGHLCPSCRQQLPATVQRHKTMGVYVPLYADAPCTNPACPQAEPAGRPAQQAQPLPEGRAAP